MSFQAYTWACDQVWGGPSARATIFAIANYANDRGFCYAKQDTLARESEQSVDTIQRRVADFVERGLVRRIKLQRFGRRTHDFLILKCSDFFESPMEVIEPFIPRGCEIAGDDRAAAGCGSDQNVTGVGLEDESEINDLAASEAVANPSQPQPAAITLPQRAVDATALVRQQEAVIEPQKDSPQTPLAGGLPSDEPDQPEKEVEGWALFEAAFTADGVPITRPSIAKQALDDVPKSERKIVTHAARGLIAHRSRERRPPNKPSAQTFIRERDAWAGWIKLAPPEPVVQVFVEVGTPEFDALRTLCRIAGWAVPVPRLDDKIGKPGVWRKAPVDADLLALASHASDPDTDWLVLEDKAREFFAWCDRVKDWTGTRIEAQVIMLDGVSEIEIRPGHKITAQKRTKGLRVPFRWPPRKDGSIGKTGDDPPDQSAA